MHRSPLPRIAITEGGMVNSENSLLQKRRFAKWETLDGKLICRWVVD
jgi:hypothetical protein